ncbi:cilia- and flagella-associated protein 91-like [Condylostylus longicornis]|uniref:cilia- and flagella-associated protein 91-like n=1 Tax=Condylostylus longicornis TaxID=2530218 RepID=UPI00244E18D7|nr:cilia- and flagella-associated protein 91-like [Condylostylus longicornis]
MEYDFEDCQFQFLNWLRANNQLHGEKDAWRLNSFSMDYTDHLSVNLSDAELLGINRDDPKDVKGKLRAKYFHHLTNVASKFVPAIPFDTEEYSCFMPIITEKSREVSVQTKYRESSVQTSPFEPEFFPDEKNKYLETEIYSICRAIQDIEEPGQYEISLIERLKRRRALEKVLNTCRNKNDIDRYRRVIKTFEWEEWMAREEDIQYYQNLRLQTLRELLDEKNCKMRNISDQKILYRIEQIKKKSEYEMLKIQNKYNRDMRKIEYKRKNIPRKYPKSDILDEHTKMDSELYAPQMRYGVNPKRKHFIGYKTKFNMRIEDINRKMIKPTVVECPFAFTKAISKPKEPPKEYTVNFLTDKRLKTLYETLKHFRIKLEPKPRDAPKCLKEKETIPESETKITVFGIEQDVEGRAIQSMLYAGKEELKGLIHEIDSTHSLKAIETLFPDITKEKKSKQAQMLAKQKYSEQISSDNKNLKSIIHGFEGSIIGPLFEFLEKELDRLYEQKRIQAIVMLAERERYKREAKEAGKRQYENRLREKYSEAYIHMAKSTKDNISMYLEDVLLDDISRKAAFDSRRKIIDIARDLDRFSEQMIENPTLPHNRIMLDNEELLEFVTNQQI